MAVSIKERRNKDGKITSFTISNYLGKDNNGKLIFKYKTIKVDPNMKESAFRKKVQEEAIIFERDLAEGRITASTQRFGDYLDYVLNLKKERETCKTTTLDGYNHMRTGILSVFGRMKVTDIKPEQQIMPTKIYRNIETGTERMEIAFKRRGFWNYAVFPKSTICARNKIIGLADLGIVVNSKNATELGAYLIDIDSLNEYRIPIAMSVNRLGWVKDGSFAPFVEGVEYDGSQAKSAITEQIRIACLSI